MAINGEKSENDVLKDVIEHLRALSARLDVEISVIKQMEKDSGIRREEI